MSHRIWHRPICLSNHRNIGECYSSWCGVSLLIPQPELPLATKNLTHSIIVLQEITDKLESEAGADVKGIPEWVTRMQASSSPSGRVNAEEVAQRWAAISDCGALRSFQSLYPFQKQGVRRGLEWGGRLLLADEMGLGKTVQVRHHSRNQYHCHRRALLSPV